MSQIHRSYHKRPNFCEGAQSVLAEQAQVSAGEKAEAISTQTVLWNHKVNHEKECKKLREVVKDDLQKIHQQRVHYEAELEDRQRSLDQLNIELSAERQSLCRSQQENIASNAELDDGKRSLARLQSMVENLQGECQKLKHTSSTQLDSNKSSTSMISQLQSDLVKSQKKSDSELFQFSNN